MAPFWLIDHTADLALLVRAGDLPGLFLEAAKGLTLLLVGEYPVLPQGWREISLSAPDKELLFVDFLSEINSLAVTEELAAVKVELTELSPTGLTARLGLRRIKDLGGLKREIKAVTYHRLGFKETDSGLEAVVVLDV